MLKIANCLPPFPYPSKLNGIEQTEVCKSLSGSSLLGEDGLGSPVLQHGCVTSLKHMTYEL